jgi:phage-related protein
LFTFLETSIIFAMKNEIGERPERKFETRFTDEALKFLEELDMKGREKILSNIRKAEVTINNELFKKLRDDIWEFRTLYKKCHYRLLAFWDKEERAVVIVTCGFIKKTNKTPNTLIEKAITMKNKYYIEKSNANENL